MMMKVLFVSLGCDKNLVDSEVMLGLLAEKGYTFTDDETKADIIIVNTCGFIKDAKEESVNTLLEMAEYKRRSEGPDRDRMSGRAIPSGDHGRDPGGGRSPGDHVL